MTDLGGKKVLVTGLTGSVGYPVATRLARTGAEVWGLARFGAPGTRDRLEAAGVRCVTGDLIAGNFSNVPDDVDYVLNFAVTHAPDFETALATNAEGVGLLMGHCRKATAFLHCSTTGVYQPDGRKPFAENDALGDNHRPAGMVTYSISKIAAEAVVRSTGRLLEVPVTIARLNVPYGDTWGWPRMQLDWMLSGSEVYVHSDGPTVYNPIHEDDIVAMIPRLLDVASVPATLVNWAGEETVSIETWCAYMAEMVGIEPKLVPTPMTIPSVAVDITRMRSLIGSPTVGWRDGFRRLVECSYPDRVLKH
ncbi:MAG: NAD(P)-dependent oxidoreductase [Acidimicrobiaceae bacterium]|nr:NAD(P)-dependent oxidoreductase [Acidimicrobiaceae bacterium]